MAQGRPGRAGHRVLAVRRSACPPLARTRARRNAATPAASAVHAPENAARLTIYVAGSFKHKHGVRLFCRELAALGCRILDWTEKATPPPGLTPQERRVWMDTDRAGGSVYAFCREACRTADLVVYYGASGQDAGVEVGLATGAGVPVLGIRGPLEAPGLMLHGAGTAWVDSVEEALELVARLMELAREPAAPLPHRRGPLRRLAEALLARRGQRGEGGTA